MANELKTKYEDFMQSAEMSAKHPTSDTLLKDATKKGQDLYEAYTHTTQDIVNELFTTFPEVMVHTMYLVDYTQTEHFKNNGTGMRMAYASLLETLAEG